MTAPTSSATEEATPVDPAAPATPDGPTTLTAPTRLAAERAGRRGPADLPFAFPDRGLAVALAAERSEPDWRHRHPDAITELDPPKEAAADA